MSIFTCVVLGCFCVAGNLVLSHQADDVKDRLDKLTQRWNQICGGILERHRALKAASHHYGEFKVLTAQECDWQDKLEKKLLRSTTLAADAEEISEELDVSCSTSRRLRDEMAESGNYFL